MNAKSTRRALTTSVISLIICVVMLMGTTFAWFTDSVTSGKNTIVAGNLDVDLLYSKDLVNWTSVEGKSDLFDANALWEPGHTEVIYLKVVNLGTLALKYEFSTNFTDTVIGTSVLENDIKLSEYLEYGIVDANGKFATREAARDAINGAPLTAYTEAGELAAKTESAPIAYVIYMPETVGNEANHKTDTPAPKVELGVNLLATQLEYESDSFGPDYDKDATFGTYIELEAGDDLLAAMASAEADMPLTIKLNGDVEWPTEGHHGVNDVTPASSIVIDGNGNTITATGSGVTPLGDDAAPMTLKNVKIVDNSVSYAEGAWEFTYLELGGTSLTCENVTFADEIQPSTNATFTNCSFESNEASVYAVWVEAGSASFNNCTFTGYRGLKMHEDYGSEISSVVVDGCTFTDITKKPGIAIGDLNADTTVSVTNNAFINCQAGDQGLFIYETDTDVTTFNFTQNNNVVESYTELVEVGTKEELVAFANRVNGGDGMSGVAVKLTADIDLAGMEWVPVGQTGTSYGATSYFKGIFDGQGHTISNMTITNTNDGKNYAAGFFGFIDAANATIRNVNFDKANVNGHHWTGVVAGYLTGNIEKCNVTNSTVVCTHANNDACGDKAGAVVGYVNSGLVNNCTASDTTVTAGRDAGQIAGASKTAYVANCTATNVTVSATGDCTGANINNAVIGRVLG